MKAILLCLLVLLALFTSTEAARLRTRAYRAKTAAKSQQFTYPNCQFGYYYGWDCYIVDIPGIGEEESCEMIPKCCLTPTC